MFDDINPNVIIVLVVMVIGGLRWVIEQARGGKEEEPPPTSEFEDLYEEARLEILERQAKIDANTEDVSRPFETATVIRPAAIPPRTVSTPPPIPVGATTPPPVRRETPRRTPEHKPRKRVLSAAEKEALANFEALAKKPAKRRRAARSSVSVHVRQLLSNPTSAQDAIVLADILGPPKSVR